jgi:predicted acyl esterase
MPPLFPEDTAVMARRLARLALLLLPLCAFVACGGDDGGTAAAPTATVSPPATAIPTNTSTAAPPPSATASPEALATSTEPPTPTATEEPTPTATEEPTPTVAPTSFSARGSIGQVYVLDLQPDAPVELLSGGGAVVGSGSADAQGAFLFREVDPGDGYRVATGQGEERQVSASLRVTLPEEAPDESFYASQTLVAGYQYIETRDGTKLAVNVLLPGPIDGGPYPTVIEYSGYDPANPTSPQPTTLLANALGYAAVGINMRGSGCSGGAFDFFETLQVTDGFDAVEIVAAQPWVRGNKVGMVGISYPGISQLFVAHLQPPGLAAIAPLAVIADIAQGILYPGGILNNGFAVGFAADRQRDALPGGQPWAQARMDAGDQICIDNQKLRFQSADLFQRIEDNPYYVPEVADPLSPQSFVDRIEVPVFLAGAWQDEQTGGYFATMIDRFTGTDRARFTLVNGNHIEPLGPAVLTRWMEFLDLFVAERKPVRSPLAPLIAQVVNDSTFRAPGVLALEPDRFADVDTYEEALARWDAESRVRVLFESGAGGAPGAPVATFELSFDAWPIPGLEARAWYLDAGGRLVPEGPADEGADSFLYDSSRSQLTNYPGPFEDVWRADVSWDWRPPEAGKGLAWTSDPLAETLVMAGSASVDLWLQATAADVDLQVTLSEVRPDGNETYVQSGWLRASHRQLDQERSTELRPVPTHLEADAAPLPPGEFVAARVEVYPFAHVFRAGSRIRIAVGAPGGDRAAWKFEALTADGEVQVRIGRSAAMPSRIVLPVVPGAAAPAGLPPCPSLRGQPCRPDPEAAG